ncbi:RNA-binding protein 8A [Coemansia interrupta]|uniref:RNA-binding protein 8A n=1 Tax=Coemansia interrupta TaxID=1126814 RepID=A0A9W8HBD6_9FUNG|nr:RNA-binding protein 8A [Coemansia interrupta]
MRIKGTASGQTSRLNDREDDLIDLMDCEDMSDIEQPSEEPELQQHEEAKPGALSPSKDQPDMPKKKTNSAAIAQSSIEGWVVIATGVHEEASADYVRDFFSDYGKVRNLHLNLDRLTGYVKGYALVEYETEKEALQAVEKAAGKVLLGKRIDVDFAFVKDKQTTNDDRRGDRRNRHEHDIMADRLGTSSHSRRSDRTVDRTRELSPDRGF